MAQEHRDSSTGQGGQPLAVPQLSHAQSTAATAVHAWKTNQAAAHAGQGGGTGQQQRVGTSGACSQRGTLTVNCSALFLLLSEMRLAVEARRGESAVEAEMGGATKRITGVSQGCRGSESRRRPRNDSAQRSGHRQRAAGDRGIRPRAGARRKIIRTQAASAERASALPVPSSHTEGANGLAHDGGASTQARWSLRRIHTSDCNFDSESPGFCELRFLRIVDALAAR